MLKQLRPAIAFIIALTLIVGVAYPLAMTGIAGVLFPYQAQGGLVQRDGKTIGSMLIGQQFSERSLLSRPALGHDRPRSGRPVEINCGALQCRQLDGCEPWSDQQGVGRPHERRHRQA